MSLMSSGSCTYVVNLHVRKCGGTAVRSLFSGLAGWQQIGTFCSELPELISKAAGLHKRSGRYWSEVHCDEDIVDFNDGVSKLRAMLEPRGCRVLTTLLLREPVEQMVSDWVYFRQDPDKIYTRTPAQWARKKPENVYRLLLERHGEWWTGDDRSPLYPWHEATWAAQAFSVNAWAAARGDYPVPQLAKGCDPTLRYVASQMDQIDHVGVMDTAEKFAQWWLLLGDDAGFDGTRAPLKNSTRSKDPDDQTLSAKELRSMAKLNSCASKLHALAAKRLARDGAADGAGHGRGSRHKRHQSQKRLGAPSKLAMAGDPSMATRVRTLVSSWGGRNPAVELE